MKNNTATSSLTPAGLMPFNLIEKYKDDTHVQEGWAKFKEKQLANGFTDTNEAYRLKTGDVIKFVGGYNDDIEFTSEILGFDKEGDAYVLWDCWWFPVNLKRKFICKVN